MQTVEDHLAPPAPLKQRLKECVAMNPGLTTKEIAWKLEAPIADVETLLAMNRQFRLMRGGRGPDLYWFYASGRR